MNVGYIYKIKDNRQHIFPYLWTIFNNVGEGCILFDVMNNKPNKKHWHYILNSLLEV